MKITDFWNMNLEKESPLLKNPLKPSLPCLLLLEALFNFVAPVVKKCQERIFTPVQYTLYTQKIIGLWKNT